MRTFAVTQSYTQPMQRVVEAFRGEHTWKAFRDLPFVGDPVVRAFDDGEPVTIAMSYRVSVDLPPLADRFIEPEKLTFVEHSALHADGSGTFSIVPEHYSDLLQASGTTSVATLDPNRCERLIRGSVDVQLGWSGKLFERPVEDAIVGGLRDALIAQAAQLRFA